MEHPIENVMTTTLDKLKEMVDVNTIVGTPVNAPDGSTIIPVSKVSFGFVSGGGQYCAENKTGEDIPFAGGSGAGVSLNPVGFLVVKRDKVSVMSATFDTPYDRILDMVPKLIDSLKKNMKSDAQS